MPKTPKSAKFKLKMLKKFIFVLVIVQFVIIYLHWLLYKLTLVFFPAMHSTEAILVIIAMSFGFGIFSSLSHYRENWFIRIFYIFFAVWMVLAFYLFLSQALALVIFLTIGLNLQMLGEATLVLSAALTLYGLINARTIRTTSFTVKLKNLPEAWKNRTAVMVSDVHLGHVLKAGFARKVVEKINEQKPQIVFFPGDFYDGERTNFQDLADEFKKVHAPLGIFYSSGNHEMYAGYKECEDALKNVGIKVLEDQLVEVQGVQILGLAYRFETGESVSHRLQEIGIKSHMPSILLKHVPNHLHAIEKHPISLQLSGHTHLGQIWPFNFITKRVFKSYDYGYKTFGNMQIITSSGAGTWGPPIRVFTKAEIIKITFLPLD